MMINELISKIKNRCGNKRELMRYMANLREDIEKSGQTYLNEANTLEEIKKQDRILENKVKVYEALKDDIAHSKSSSSSKVQRIKSFLTPDYQFLFESKVDDVKERYDEKYHDAIEQLAEHGPKKFLTWMVKVVIEGGEDIHDVTDIANTFADSQQSIKDQGYNPDIYQYDSIEEIEQVLRDTGNLTSSQEKTEIESVKSEETYVHHDGERFKILSPLSDKASCFYSPDAPEDSRFQKTWCTGRGQTEGKTGFFNQYFYRYDYEKVIVIDKSVSPEEYEDKPFGIAAFMVDNNQYGDTNAEDVRDTGDAQIIEIQDYHNNGPSDTQAARYYGDIYSELKEEIYKAAEKVHRIKPKIAKHAVENEGEDGYEFVTQYAVKNADLTNKQNVKLLPKVEDNSVFKEEFKSLISDKVDKKLVRKLLLKCVNESKVDKLGIILRVITESERGEYENLLTRDDILSVLDMYKNTGYISNDIFKLKDTEDYIKNGDITADELYEFSHEDNYFVKALIDIEYMPDKLIKKFAEHRDSYVAKHILNRLNRYNNSELLSELIEEKEYFALQILRNAEGYDMIDQKHVIQVLKKDNLADSFKPAEIMNERFVEMVNINDISEKYGQELGEKVLFKILSFVLELTKRTHKRVADNIEEQFSHKLKRIKDGNISDKFYNKILDSISHFNRQGAIVSRLIENKTVPSEAQKRVKEWLFDRDEKIEDKLLEVYELNILESLMQVKNLDSDILTSILDERVENYARMVRKILQGAEAGGTMTEEAMNKIVEWLSDNFERVGGMSGDEEISGTYTSLLKYAVEEHSDSLTTKQIRKIAEHIPLDREEHYRIHMSLISSLVKNPETPDDLIKKIYKNIKQYNNTPQDMVYEQYNKKIAQNKSVPQEIYKDIALNSKDFMVFIHLAENSSVSQDVIDIVSERVENFEDWSEKAYKRKYKDMAKSTLEKRNKNTGVEEK